MNDFESQLRKAAVERPTEEPSRKIWLGIKHDLTTHRKKTRRQRRWLLAASIAALLCAGLIFYPSENREQVVLAQYGLMQHDFPMKVKQKIAAMSGARIPKRQAEHLVVLRDQLYFLDVQYQNYLEYIEKNGYQEFIGKQIKNYYEIKIELLERIQIEIEKFKIDRNEKDSKIETVDWNI